jgi:uncharacterized protein involved in exopolysaccharide biosynthesis
MTSLDQAQARAPTEAIRQFLRNSISIADVTRQVWSGRLIVVAALVLGLLYGLYLAHRAGPQYMAAMSVMPAQSDTDGGGGGGAIGMLASLAGGSGSQVPKFTQFLFTIGSVGVAQRLDHQYDMVCIINRGLCDPKTHIWRRRTGMNAAFNAFLARVAGLPDPNGALTVVDLAQYNSGAVAVTKDKTSGLVTLSYYNRDPKFAADYLGKIVRTTNDYIREQDHAAMRNMVDYVSHRIATNTNIDQRTALDSLLLQQERRLMMTEVDAPYAATILDGPVVTPLNTVLRTTLLNGFLFLLIGLAIVLFRGLIPQRFRFWSRIWPRS